MSEKRLTEDQKKRIREIKEQWAAEILPLFDKWDLEEKTLRQENPNAPYTLDKHLRETVAIERKYRAMIQTVMDEE